MLEAERLFRWGDPAVRESSGLVDLGARMVTVNDSGDAPRLFVADEAGRPLRTVRFAATAVDVEALAPSGPRHVWVGDIGDNARERPTVQVHRVRIDPGPGPRVVSYRLGYPGGTQHDAESMFQLRDGRLVLITKTILGGTAYVAPRALRQDQVNRLRPVGRVGELATDAALAPGGDRVLVRGLAGMGAYALPSWRRLASMTLPKQRQGEGLSVGPGGRVRISSEGARSWVWQVALPDLGDDVSSAPVAADLAEADISVARLWVVVGVAGVTGVAALGGGLLLRVRRRR